MFFTIIATIFGLSVIAFALVARSAPLLTDDGRFETASSQGMRNDHGPAL